MPSQKINPAQLRFLEATVHTPELEEALVEMFVRVFPEDARYSGFIHQRVVNALKPNPKTITHQGVVKYQEEVVGLRLFSYLRRHNIGVSGYIAVSAKYRGTGIGGWIHNQTIRQIKADAAADGNPEPFGFCGEVDHPAAAHDEADRRVRERRVQIFKRMGAWVADFGYLEPLKVEGMPIENEADLAALAPDPMLIYIVPFQPGGPPPMAMVACMVRGMLLDTYNLAEEDYFVRHAMQGIVKGVKFV